MARGCSSGPPGLTSTHAVSVGGERFAWPRLGGYMFFGIFTLTELGDKASKRTAFEVKLSGFKSQL